MEIRHDCEKLVPAKGAAEDAEGHHHERVRRLVHFAVGAEYIGARITRHAKLVLAVNERETVGHQVSAVGAYGEKGADLGVVLVVGRLDVKGVERGREDGHDGGIHGDVHDAVVHLTVHKETHLQSGLVFWTRVLIQLTMRHADNHFVAVGVNTGAVPAHVVFERPHSVAVVVLGAHDGTVDSRRGVHADAVEAGVHRAGVAVETVFERFEFYTVPAYSRAAQVGCEIVVGFVLQGATRDGITHAHLACFGGARLFTARTYAVGASVSLGADISVGAVHVVFGDVRLEHASLADLAGTLQRFADARPQSADIGGRAVVAVVAPRAVLRQDSPAGVIRVAYRGVAVSLRAVGVYLAAVFDGVHETDAPAHGFLAGTRLARRGGAAEVDVVCEYARCDQHRHYNHN